MTIVGSSKGKARKREKKVWKKVRSSNVWRELPWCFTPLHPSIPATAAALTCFFLCHSSNFFLYTASAGDRNMGGWLH